MYSNFCWVITKLWVGERMKVALSALVFACLIIHCSKIPAIAESQDSLATATDALSTANAKALMMPPLQGYLHSSAIDSPYYGKQIRQLNLDYAV